MTLTKLLFSCLIIFYFSSLSYASDRSLVYVAGPLFNKHEKLAQADIAKILEAHGFKTFLPQRDGFEGVKFHGLLKNKLKISDEKLDHLIAEVIYSLDVYQVVERCGSFVGNKDGVVMDDGSVAELTYAAMTGHPIIFYRNDSRSHFNGAMNPLVTSGAHSFVETIENIPAELRKLIKEVPEFKQVLPPTIQAKVDRGRLFWSALEQINEQTLRTEIKTQKIAEKINEIFKF